MPMYASRLLTDQTVNENLKTERTDMISDIRHAQEALQYIDAHDRDSWVKAAMALKSEFSESARDIWEQWSSQADNYSPRDAASVWRSCKVGAIGIGTLFHLAKQNGWQSSIQISIDPAGINAHKIAVEHQRKQAEKNRLQRQHQVATKAQYLWSKSDAASFNHPYLQEKKIKPHSLRELNGALVVPLAHKGQTVNLQFIYPNGGKRFLRGGQVTGASASVGILGDVFYIAEGFATGATIHQITGRGVLCAMNAGNLIAIAQQARTDYPDAHIVIAGDNDHQAKVNTGKMAAYKAARIIGAEVLIPELPSGASGSDWNDLYLLEQGSEL